MKYILLLEELFFNESTYQKMPVTSSEIKMLDDLLKTNAYNSQEVEDFFTKLDSVGIKKFMAFYEQAGVTSLKSLKILTKFLRSFVDDDFLKKVTQSTKSAFEKMEDLLKLGDKLPTQLVEKSKKSLEDKAEILRRLEYLEKRISRYKDDL